MPSSYRYRVFARWVISAVKGFGPAVYYLATYQTSDSLDRMPGRKA